MLYSQFYGSSCGHRQDTVRSSFQLQVWLLDEAAKVADSFLPKKNGGAVAAGWGPNSSAVKPAAPAVDSEPLRDMFVIEMSL